MKKGITLFTLGMALMFTACNGGVNQEALQNEADSEFFGGEQKGRRMLRIISQVKMILLKYKPNSCYSTFFIVN